MDKFNRMRSEPAIRYRKKLSVTGIGTRLQWFPRYDTPAWERIPKCSAFPAQPDTGRVSKFVPTQSIGMKGTNGYI